MPDINDNLAKIIEATPSTGPVDTLDTLDTSEPLDTDTGTKKKTPKKAKDPMRLVIKRGIIENKKDKENPNKPVIEYDHTADIPKRIQLLEWMRIEAEERANIPQIITVDILLAGLRRDLVNKQQQATRDGEFDPEDSQYLKSANWAEWDDIDRLPPEHMEAIAHETRKALNFPIYDPESQRYFVYDGRYIAITVQQFLSCFSNFVFRHTLCFRCDSRSHLLSLCIHDSRFNGRHCARRYRCE